MKPPSYRITLARLENERADTPFSRSGPPRPLRSRGMPDESGTWTALVRPAKPKGTLSDPALIAALAIAAPDRWIARPPAVPICAECPLPSMNEMEKKIPMSFSPPRFKTLKKGPHVGNTVEVKFIMRFLIREISYRDPAGNWLIYSATARLTKNGIIPPANVKVGDRAMALAEVSLNFTRRWPSKAAGFSTYLRFAE